MTTLVHGNLFRVDTEANEVSQNNLTITLPDGYSVETIHITMLSNIQRICETLSIMNNQIYTFPAVDGKSPCSLNLRITDKTKPANIAFVIEKFGRIPDIHYFDIAFEPIRVTGKDGEEYNMIPSDQFK